MIATNDSSPHENEYLAAVSGLPEQTPSPRVYAIGDFVSGTSGGLRWWLLHAPCLLRPECLG